MKLKVKESPNLLRDADSKAIINTDQTGLNSYLEKRKLFETMLKLNERVDKLEQELKEIKATQYK